MTALRPLLTAAALAALSLCGAARACLKTGLRLVTKASMPSFWSAVANSEWNTWRS
jgi:hypothetical protein